MAACKLYIRSMGNDWYIGSFPNKEKAEAFYHAAIAWIETEYQCKQLTPIYVEARKGKVT